MARQDPDPVGYDTLFGLVIPDPDPYKIRIHECCLVNNTQTQRTVLVCFCEHKPRKLVVSDIFDLSKA